jgi:hypothetical protein
MLIDATASSAAAMYQSSLVRGQSPSARTGANPSEKSCKTQQEQTEVEQLKKRDHEVRTHEQAHQAAGGDLVGGANYQFRQGPDGQSYAVNGEVPVDASPVKGDPQATVAKMERVRDAALAPADPSGQDQAVAAKAAAEEAKAHSRTSSQKTGQGRGSKAAQAYRATDPQTTPQIDVEA